MSLKLADMVEALGGQPWFLSRGYGGRLDGQELVDAARHTAAEVGDEPLLLAARAPTVVSRDRRLGVEFISRQAPANAVIIMDDGLQNPAIAKDLTIALVDRARGLGNGDVIPAGPLRAPLDFQIRQTDIIVVNGASGEAGDRDLDHAAAARVVLRLTARTQPRQSLSWLSGQRVVAFAGIANPDRFFSMLEGAGAVISDRRIFNDHQTLSTDDAGTLLQLADDAGAILVTTEKDHVRLRGLDATRITLHDKAKPIAIELVMPEADQEMIRARIQQLLAR